MNRNERTPRTLAETSFHTGYPAARLEQAKEAGRYVVFTLAVVGAVFGGSLVARYFGG